jgi:hypothetical protein
MDDQLGKGWAGGRRRDPSGITRKGASRFSFANPKSECVIKDYKSPPLRARLQEGWPIYTNFPPYHWGIRIVVPLSMVATRLQTVMRLHDSFSRRNHFV